MTGRSIGQRDKKPGWVRYGGALLIQAALCGFLQWLHPYFPIGEFPAPYAAALLFTVLLYGEGPAVLALLLGFSTFYYYFTTPGHTWAIPQTTDRWTSVAAYMIVNGTVIVAVGFLQRARQRAERLTASLREHTEIVDLAPVLIRDADDRIIVWNKGLEKLYGFTKEEALGRVSHDLFQTVFPQSREAFVATLAKAGQWEGELTHTAKDGSKIHVASHQVVHRDTEGKPTAILEVNNDITGRVQAQRALEKALQDLAEADQDKDMMNEELRASNDELLREVSQRTKAEDDLKKSEEQFHVMAECLAQLAWMAEPDGYIFWYNQRWYDYTGTTAEEMKGWGWQKVHDPAVLPAVLERWKTCIAEGKPFDMEFPLLGADGVFRPFLTHGVPVKDSDGKVVRWIGTNTDISERKRSEQEREMAVEFLQIMNSSRDIRELIREATSFFQRKSGCEAVGIRLKDQEDYPYYEARGFPEEFVSEESSLCSRDSQGCVIRDSDGYPICECMCGNIIQARFDPCKPFFTEHGSFWTNSTTELLSTSTESDRQARTRNRCNGEGYESVALIPLHVGDDDRLGLLQLNDHKKGMFSADMIELWERFADYLAVALTKFQAEEALLQSEMHRRDFYRQTILAATDGKLVISEPDEIREAAGQMVREWPVRDIKDVGRVRIEATAAARDMGMDESRIYDFMACVVESTGNAAKHAKNGWAALYRQDARLLFVVSDTGPGISTMRLPDVALTRGYTTAGTLGMGYKVMISFADRVYLATGPDGTTVAIEMALHAADPDSETAVSSAIV